MSEFWVWIAKDSISFFTFILAIFTIVLAVTSVWQGWVTRRSLELATNEFRATHRPRIAVRSFQTLSDDTKEVPSVTFSFVNTGELPAKVITIDHYIGFGNVMRARQIFIRDQLKDVILESGDKEIFEMKAPLALLFNSSYSEAVGFQGNLEKGADAYIIGCVIYEDMTGRRRETGFCRLSEGSSNPWITVKDSEYEYQD